jgi:hypothetical protein
MKRDKVIVRSLQARKTDRLLRGVMEGKKVICGYEPTLPSKAKLKNRKSPRDPFGPSVDVDGHLVVTSSKITIVKGLLYVVCPECGDQAPLYKVGLRHVRGDLRNQPRCSPCRKEKKKP